MAFLFTNKAITFLDSNLSSVATTIILASGEGSKFPVPAGGRVASLVLEDRLTGEFEIIYMTGRTGDQLSVSRGQEGTLPTSWPQGTNLSLRTTAAALNGLGSAQDGVDANAAAITNLQNQVNALSGTILQTIYPVGSLYLSTLSTNPSASLGFGTWVAYATGRAIVGVGNNGESTWSVNQQRGSETHTLTADEVPAHTHGAGSLSADQVADHTHGLAFNVWDSGNQNAIEGGGNSGPRQFTEVTQPAGAHSHSISGNTAETGGGQPHNNVQPSIGVYVWRRTA